jgi:hypothetical protein
MVGHPRGRRRNLWFVALAFALPACASGPISHARPAAHGPPQVRTELVRAHARWFDEKDPVRVAGSQQEVVAASYLLARMELAGYQVNLDPVPVGNLLHSTNVIALPPSGSLETVVLVDYDTAPTAPSDGLALGTFLELARALRASEPEHSVEFVALGAEHTTANGGQVGERSLIQQLRDQSRRPQIVRVGVVRMDRAKVAVAGPARGAIRSTVARLHYEIAFGGAPRSDVFTRAGFPETIIAGNLSIGRVLLAYLARTSSASSRP